MEREVTIHMNWKSAEFLVLYNIEANPYPVKTFKYTCVLIHYF